MFPQENRCQADGDCAVEGSQHADYGDLLDAHSKIVHDERAVSVRPMPRIQPATRSAGGSIGLRAARIKATVSTELVRRMSQTVCVAPVAGTIRVPSSQNKKPKPTAEQSARPMPFPVRCRPSAS